MDPIVELVPFGKRPPPGLGEVPPWIPGGATNRLGNGMDQATSPLEEGAVKILPRRGFLQLGKLRLETGQDLRQLRP